MATQRQDEFHQRIIASTLPHDPKLEIAAALFDEPQSEEAEDGGVIMYPTTEEEFEEMVKLYGLNTP